MTSLSVSGSGLHAKIGSLDKQGDNWRPSRPGERRHEEATWNCPGSKLTAADFFKRTKHASAHLFEWRAATCVSVRAGRSYRSIAIVSFDFFQIYLITKLHDGYTDLGAAIVKKRGCFPLAGSMQVPRFYISKLLAWHYFDSQAN